MTEQWQELKETIIELRDNDGTGTQQEVCRFLVSYMDILEKQSQEPKTGHWIEEINDYGKVIGWHCDKCYEDSGFTTGCKWDFCPNCGAKMVEPQERSDKE